MDSNQALKENPKLLKAMANGNALTLFSGMADSFRAKAPAMCHAILQEFRDHRPDLLINGTMAAYFAWYGALVHNIPFLDMMTGLVIHNHDRCLFGFPTLPFGLHRYFISHLILGGFYNGLQIFDKVLGQNVLQQFSKSKMLEYAKSPTMPRIVFCSPLSQPILYPSVEGNVKFVGSAIIPIDDELQNSPSSSSLGDVELKQQIQDFINRGNCVYMGWGSMTSKSPQHMTEFAVRALFHCQQRGIILSGYAGLSLQELQNAGVEDTIINYAKTHVMFVNEIPHEWLFPRVLATIHHGGAGTTAASLRSGRPTIITPIFFDQFDNAYLINKLGMGIGFDHVQLQAMTYQQLGDAIRRVVSSSKMSDQARSIRDIVRKENGAVQSVIELEQFWNHYVVTGRFQQLFPGKCNQSDNKKAFWAPNFYTVQRALCFAAFVGSAVYVGYTIVFPCTSSRSL